MADPPDPNIETAFRENIDVIKGQHSDAEKAIALCWIMHLLGDGHQPLHAVSLFSTEYPSPKGDQGGNKEFIRLKPDGEPMKLHRFWDGVISTTEDTRDLHKLAIELRNKYPQEQIDPDPSHVTPAQFADWIQESAIGKKRRVSGGTFDRESGKRNSACGCKRVYSECEISRRTARDSGRLSHGGYFGTVVSIVRSLATYYAA